jgi:hypothetical protein
VGIKLNGWQRLWIVAVVMWLLPVIVFSYELWPTTANVSKDEVYAQLRPDDLRLLVPLKPVGTLSPVPAAKVTLDLSRSIPLPSQPVAEGHQVYFLYGVPPEEMNQITRTYALILHHILSTKRAAFTVKMFGFWMVPTMGLYLAGWAIAWVRRGFRQVA